MSDTEKTPYWYMDRRIGNYVAYLLGKRPKLSALYHINCNYDCGSSVKLWTTMVQDQ